MEQEVWAGAWYDGVDYSWRFEVSTWGRIRNAKTKRIYALHAGTNEYLQICTSVCGKNKNIRVHRCVAETFLPNPDGLEIVNHRDGTKEITNYQILSGVHVNIIMNTQWIWS